jgi:predicted nucleic acid-binding protein
MRVFIDANILVSVLNKEYPLFTFSSRVLSLADDKRFDLVTSPVCLAIAFYFAEKKSGTKSAKNKIGLLLQHIGITNLGEVEVKLASQNKKANDFEDAMQYYSAVNSKCKCIVTEDVGDYFYSDLEVLASEDFLGKYALVK